MDEKYLLEYIELGILLLFIVQLHSIKLQLLFVGLYTPNHLNILDVEEFFSCELF